MMKKIIPYLFGIGFILISIQLVQSSDFFKLLYGLVTLIILYMVIKLWFNNRFIKKIQSYYSVHVFGHKRSGKDLSTQNVIYLRFHKSYKKMYRKFKKILHDHNLVIQMLQHYFYYYPNYVSNIDYGYGARVIEMEELKIFDERTKHMITYDDILTGRFKAMKISKNDLFEGLDLYISDGQLAFPNTEHNSLDKKYPWLPVFIALSGQLYNMNVIVNTQEYVRLWTKLRGQQDAYIRALKTTPRNKTPLQKMWPHIPILRNYLFTKVRYFSEQQAAEANTLPFNASAILDEGTKFLHLGAGQATKEQFKATHGVIKDMWTVIKIKHIKYDTRIYHLYMFGYRSNVLNDVNKNVKA